MSWFSKSVVSVNSTLSDARKFYNSATATRARMMAREVTSGMNLKSAGFGLQAAAYGAVGGGAGYALSDDRKSGAVRGASLGVLGALGHRGFAAARSSPGVRSVLGDLRSAGASRLNSMVTRASRYEQTMAMRGMRKLDPSSYMAWRGKMAGSQ